MRRRLTDGDVAEESVYREHARCFGSCMPNTEEWPFSCGKEKINTVVLGVNRASLV